MIYIYIYIYDNEGTLPEAVKRILKTSKEIQNDPDSTFSSCPTQPPTRFVHTMTRMGNTKTERTPSAIRK